jgi:hypothetical protein
MSAGTKRRMPERTVRQGTPLPEPAVPEWCYSRRRTVMRALRRFAGVTREYQSDLASKRPASSAFSGPPSTGPPAGNHPSHRWATRRRHPRLDRGRSISVRGLEGLLNVFGLAALESGHGRLRPARIPRDWTSGLGAMHQGIERSQRRCYHQRYESRRNPSTAVLFPDPSSSMLYENSAPSEQRRPPPAIRDYLCGAPGSAEGGR